MPEAESRLQISLEPELRTHLKGVYFCLGSLVISTAVGCILFYCEMFQYGVTSSLLTFILITALHLLPDDGKNFWLRFSIMTMFGFCSGQLLGPLMVFVALIDQKLIISSLIGCFVLYLSLTLTALFSSSGKYLVLNRVLIAGCNSMTIMTLINVLLQSMWIQYVQLYLGVFIMAGFVLYNTQVVMEKFRSGNHDIINHSLDLFFDMANLLRKLLILLTELRKVDKM